MENVVYMITNKLNGMSYIGSAMNFNRRHHNHLSMVRRKVHHNSYFQNAWHKYGKENFIFEIIDQVDDPEQLTDCEQWWIDSFDFDNLYNSCPKAGSSLGRPHTEETKEKLRQANLGKKHTEKSRKKMSIARTGEKNHMFGKCHTELTIEKIYENMPHRKPVAQIDKDSNEVIATFISISEATRETGISRSSIRNVCSQKTIYRTDGRTYSYKTASGYKWEFIDKNE